jgi:hypothetical protein
MAVTLRGPDGSVIGEVNREFSMVFKTSRAASFSSGSQSFCMSSAAE